MANDQDKGWNRDDKWNVDIQYQIQTDTVVCCERGYINGSIKQILELGRTQPWLIWSI